ncbi:PEP-CTERM sorting domain-containing protein [Stieleria mannarensis]|uniref:PEP-CTERM sorting domain-containing protein n=1 Tax=Stieleria mannarensis TaxID=2755585 RepID=UPI001601D31A|nr:PEP-CTERM sorting domain-containing protein [Rhodopirellula sp. JC639]
MSLRILTFAFAVLSTLHYANAEISYDLLLRTSRGDGIDSTLATNAGEKLTAEIVIRETVTGTNTSLLGAANLNAYNLSLQSIGGDGLFESLTLNGDGGFDAGSTPTSLTFASFGPGFGQPGRSSIDRGNGIYEASLGTVTLQAPTAGETRFVVSDGTAVDGDFTTFQTVGFGLESAATNSGGGFIGRALTLSTQVTAIPEPSSVLALSLVCSAGLLRSRRRRK